jgi:hypothetical protein
MTLLFTVAMNTLWYVLCISSRIIISGEFSCMASQMYKVAFQTNVFVSLRPKEQVIRLTNGMKGIKKGFYVIHLKLM